VCERAIGFTLCGWTSEAMPIVPKSTAVCSPQLGGFGVVGGRVLLNDVLVMRLTMIVVRTALCVYETTSSGKN
jgi:hypothetical protein